MTDQWPFADPKNVAVFTTAQVLAGAPILRVTHDAEDGAWQFLSRDDVRDEDVKLVSLYSITLRDPSVQELADLPLGWQAERATTGDHWRRSQQ